MKRDQGKGRSAAMLLFFSSVDRVQHEISSEADCRSKKHASKQQKKGFRASASRAEGKEKRPESPDFDIWAPPLLKCPFFLEGSNEDPFPAAAAAGARPRLINQFSDLKPHTFWELQSESFHFLGDTDNRMVRYRLFEGSKPCDDLTLLDLGGEALRVLLSVNFL